jgi:3-methyladenine DNA glycosylase/8-oxoguanine DNA glycosylase
MRTVGQLSLAGAGGEPADFRRILASHGVATLPPQHVDEAAWCLDTTLADGNGAAHTLRVREATPGRAVVEAADGRRSAQRDRWLLGAVRHLLRLDEDLSGFYAQAAADAALSWVTAGAGRMLRSLTVFEDVVKTICTTNCTWSATVRMTTALVDHLGAPAPGGGRAFPSPQAIAEAGPDFYRDVARAGYRSGYLIKLAGHVAEGRLNLEELTDPGLPDAEVEKRLLALPGVGPYAAAHIMLISLGRYQRLILDSWTRPTYAKLTGRKARDTAIERRFRRYGRYAGLAFWLYLTRDWVPE